MEARGPAREEPSFGTLLRQHRLAAGLSQEALAERARVSVEGISALERGFRRTPQRETLALLAAALALDDEQLRAFEAAATGTPLPRRRGPSVTVGPWPSSGANLPAGLTTFVGREAELDALAAALAEASIAAVYGLGGVGKTSLAREYVVRHADRYSAISWLDAQTEDGIIDGLLGLGAAHIQILEQLPNRRAAARQVMYSVLGHFDKPVLLVFDNLEEERYLRAWLPQRGARALVTTRNATWSSDVAALPLQVWPIEIGAEYLQRESRRRDFSDADARGIAEALGTLPLALAHAAASLREMRMLTPARYLANISAYLATAPRAAEYPQSVSATFQAAIVQAEQEARGAAAVLCFAASFAPDGIPDELFRQDAENYPAGLRPTISDGDALELNSVIADEVHLDAALGALDRLSLLVFSDDSRTYRIHRLVRFASRDLIGGDARAWHQCAVTAAAAAFPQVVFENWAQCARLLPHARAALEGLPSDAVFARAAWLAFQCGNYLAQRGEHKEAERLIGLSLAARERSLGLTHPDVASSLNVLGIIYREQGRYHESEAAYTRALTIRERAFGPDHLDVSYSLGNLAIPYMDHGRFDEAIVLHKRALTIREKALGPDHPDVAECLNNLGCAYAGQGRYNDAVEAHRRALAIRERAFRPDHPNLAASLLNIGEAYFKLGRYDEAEPLLTRAFAVTEDAFGSDHPNLAYFLENLGNLYRSQKRYEEAEPLLMRALAIREKSLAKEDPRLASSLRDLADLYREQGRSTDAQPLYSRALAILENTLGPDHSDTKATREKADGATPPSQHDA